MTLKCGIVGLPNVGKSTLFNALTNAGIDVANYPFCTIEPNLGIVEVPDLRLIELAQIVHPQKIQSAIVEFVDIAGLVKGASLGEGLGNQFLANIRETDAIIHVVRCFNDDNIIHVTTKVNPLDDVITINTELALADLATVEKFLIKETKKAKSGDKVAQELTQFLEKILVQLNQGLAVRSMNLSQQEHSLIQPLCLLTVKPMMYVANVNENGFHDNELLVALEKYLTQEQNPMIAICANIEAELAELSITEKKEFLQTMGIKESGLDRLISAAFKLLGLQTYFTAGIKEVRAWTIKIGANAPQAAGVIHSDFTKGFIRAEVIPYLDFIYHKGEQGAKEAGKMRVEGKEYIVKDGDIMHFRFNV